MTDFVNPTFYENAGIIRRWNHHYVVPVTQIMLVYGGMSIKRSEILHVTSMIIGLSENIFILAGRHPEVPAFSPGN